MMASLRHRGPDDEGLVVAPSVALGMTRLSIIDLPGGHQPVWNEDGTVAVVFNGEIYNFQELRQTLESLGHRFQTRSDTEAIVHAYEAWGRDCVQRLRGMFAFAIVETPQGASDAPKRLFLARDRLGIKPLYYAARDGMFLFASEIRALLASGLIPARLSSSALPAYLLFGSVAEPTTLVEGVFSLPPGHCVTLSATSPSSKAEITGWWDFARGAAMHAEQPKMNGGAPVAKSLRARLEDAVRSHLIADVPLGVFLSSGLDSTAIAALASRERQAIHTFTVMFPEQDFSEAEIARRTAACLGTEHQQLLLSGEEMQSRLGEAVAALDQPSMDGINTYFVSWAARQAGLKVALSGLGSDEIFGGYSTFRSTPGVARLAAAARWFPSSLRSATAPAFEGASARRGGPDAARKLTAAWLDPNAMPHPYFFTRNLFAPRTVAELLHEGLGPARASTWWNWLVEASRSADRLDRFSAVSWLESRSYLVNTLLRDTDAMSMHHSLEVRVPFLDHLLVEFVISLPEAEKRRGKIPKALLVEALEDLLPAEVVAQPKRTFTFPWEKWLRGPLREQVEAGLRDCPATLQPILNHSIVQSIWQDFLDGRTSWSRPWSLYVLNEWVRRNLEGSGSSVPAEHQAATTSVA
jgi:asparagine synthase (glutamine-hydrolysing)